MAWGKNGTPSTLTVAGDDLDITDLTAYKFNQYMSHILTSSTFSVFERYNSVSSGSLYHGRYETNGTTDQTYQANQIYPMLDNSGGTNMSAGDYFNVTYQVNIATEEKLIIGHSIIASNTGAGTAPKRNQYVAKFANTSDQITSISNTNTSTGSYRTDSNLSVLTGDATETVTLQDGTIFEETDTNKAYIWNASTATWTQL